MKLDPSRATAFLDAGRIAVVGASNDPRNFGRAICEALTEHGIDVVAVHPTAPAVADVPCYPSVAALPDGIAGAIVMVSREQSASVVRDCAARGIKRVWLFKGVGAGAVSDEALRMCDELGLEVVPGACPLMFLEPVTGVHRMHRGIRHLNRSLARTG